MPTASGIIKFSNNSCDDMALLFISNIVPDKEPYNGVGFTRSSNNVFLGIEKALPDDPEAELVSCRPVASFPHGPLWIKSEDIKLRDGRVIHLLPCLNIKILKNLYWGFVIQKYIKEWSRRNSDKKRNVLVYNIYTPPISSIYKACKKYSCKLTSILYDLGVPPRHLKLGVLTMCGYKHMEKVAEKYIPLLDGRIVINESIVGHYAPNEHYLLIDGGINEQVEAKLFPLENTKSERYTFVLAGMLWAQNGTQLVLDCLESNQDLDIRVVFAGIGNDVQKIKAAAAKDNRIEYAGMLNQDELFKLYQQSDVLLNLRIEEEVDYHFPSKLLEYLVTGKHVLSTSIAHAERDYGEHLTILRNATPEALADSIRQIISIDKNTLLQKGIKARSFMLQNRSWRQRTKQILDYISKL